MLFVQRIVDELAAYDPAFSTLPAPASFEARAAALAVASRCSVDAEHGRAARRDRLVDGATVRRDIIVTASNRLGRKVPNLVVRGLDEREILGARTGHDL